MKTSEYDMDEGSAKLDNGVLCIGGGESNTFKFKSIECFGIKWSKLIININLKQIVLLWRFDVFMMNE